MHKDVKKTLKQTGYKFSSQTINIVFIPQLLCCSYPLEKPDLQILPCTKDILHQKYPISIKDEYKYFIMQVLNNPDN